VTRIACLMMQKDEEILLRPWLLYHGYLFGFENLYVFDFGSSSKAVLATLAEFASLGVNIDFTPAAHGDAGATDLILRETISRFHSCDSYDVAVPLDCGEFIAGMGKDGIGCHRTEILAEFDQVSAGGVSVTQGCLENLPGFIDRFRYLEYRRSIVTVRRFLDGIDGTDPANPQAGPTALLYVRFVHSPFEENNAHPQRYPSMSPLEDYVEPCKNAQPVVRFRGLARFLRAVMDFGATCDAWEAGRPEVQPPGLLEFDLDSFPFRPKDYLAANPGMPRSGLDLFGHFLRAGYQEGQPLEMSHAGLEEVVERMAVMRTNRRDGVAGYAGLIHAFSSLGRADEAEEIVRRGIEEFGETLPLLREHALISMYRQARQQAVQRWARFRALFPDNQDGYDFGCLASHQAGDMAEAERIALTGLDRFPRHVGMSLRLIDIAMDRRDWTRVEAIWTALLEAAPDSAEVRERAGSITFQIRSWRSSKLDADPVDALDGPVIVAMSAQQTREALDYLGCTSTQEMRQIFMQFESLGHSCEFGLVQRRYGAEPISLLRWNSIHSRKLIEALEARFEGIDDADNLTFVNPGREYVLLDKTYLTAMHTFIYEGGVDADKLLKQQIKRMKFLRRKLLADLEAQEKIFVHLDDESLSGDEIERLRRAFRSCGGGCLLYVRVADAPAKVGTVEVGAEGLLLGYIERLGRGSYGDWNIAFESWLPVCRSAFAHWSTVSSRGQQPLEPV
jgi:hypothetical protein